MAISVIQRNPLQVIGDRKVASIEIRFTSAGTGTLDTGLYRVEFADVQAIDDSDDVTNADIEVSVFRNNNTTTDNGTVNGSIHITGADVGAGTTDGFYHVRAVGW